MIPQGNRQAEESFEQGIALARRGDYERAIAAFEDAVVKNPSHERAWEELAQAIHNLADYGQAERTFSRARAAGVKSHQFWYALAQSLSGAMAQEAYRFALEADPQDEQALTELAWSLRSTGKKEEANKLYRYLLEVYSQRGDARALNSLGDTLRRLVGNLEDAEEAFSRALEITPDDFETWKNMSYLMCSRRDPARAQQTIRRFIERYPQHARAADAWVCLANVLRSFDDLRGAEEAARQALHVNPDCQSAWSKLADICFESGNFEEGQRALDRADSLDYNKKFD